MSEEMMNENNTKIFEKWRVITLCLIAGIILAVGIADDRMDLKKETEKERLKVRDLKFEVAKLQNDLWYEQELKRIFASKLSEIKKTGHVPDSSLVWQAMNEIIKYNGWVTWSDLDSIFPQESGWGRDKRRGMFGEIRISQIDTATQKQILMDLGFDVTCFDPEAYGNPQTAAQYAVLYVALTKSLRGDFRGPFLRRYYYNGMHTTIDTLNTSRFDSVMSALRERQIHGR